MPASLEDTGEMIAHSQISVQAESSTVRLRCTISRHVLTMSVTGF